MAVKHFEVYAPWPTTTPGFEARAVFRHEMAGLCNGFLEHEVSHFELDEIGQISSVDWESWDVVADNDDKPAILGHVQTYLNAINEPAAYLILPEGQVEVLACGV